MTLVSHNVKIHDRLTSYPPNETVYLLPRTSNYGGDGGDDGGGGGGYGGGPLAWNYHTNNNNSNNSNTSNYNSNNNIYFNVSLMEGDINNNNNNDCNNNNNSSNVVTLDNNCNIITLEDNTISTSNRNSNTRNPFNRSNSSTSSSSSSNNNISILDISSNHHRNIALPTQNQSQNQTKSPGNIPRFLPQVEEKDLQQPISIKYCPLPPRPSPSAHCSAMYIPAAAATYTTTTAPLLSTTISSPPSSPRSPPLSPTTTTPPQTPLSSLPLALSNLSSSSSSSPPSLSPLSLSSVSSSSSISSSFTEINYKTSSDELYLRDKSYSPECIQPTPSPLSTKGSLNMINAINCYNSENNEMIYNDNNNTCSIFEWNSSDFVSHCSSLPEFGMSFGSPKQNTNITINCDVTSSNGDVSGMPFQIDDDNSDQFDLETYLPVGGDDLLHFFKTEEDDEEDAFASISDCGDSSGSDNTLLALHVQSSPISNESSSDWSGSFQNKLPVFEEIQVSTQESVKRRKPSTPSPRPNRKPTNSPNSNEKERKKPGRKPGQVSNVLHLWEFMRDLLHDPSTSEGIIQWVSKVDGVFRVVDSSAVARLWGQKKNNKKEMTYEKLSRSLRYSRLEGYFDSLPKDKNYPKKLCFKFGPKSRHFSTMNGSVQVKSEH